jgi:carboxyl-terminal processing protease
VSGRFEGIGAEIGERKGQIQIIAPLEGTPAQKAGLRAGDKIIKINETLTTDLSVDEAVDLIRGPKGTEVTLSIFREGWNSPKEIKIKRAIIEVPSIKWELKDSDIAYIKLSQFSQNADTDFQNAAIEIIRSPAKKIILDLRNNPGGYLEISKEIGGWFLEKNQTVVIEDFQKSGDKKYYNAEGNSKLLTYPIVVLINKGSASASEILAAALRDNRGVKLIGETSYGKGSVQELEKLRGGSTIKITVAKWLTPKGNLIDGVGLEPDIKVEMTDKDYDEDKDPQLDKALEMIKEIK